MLEGTLFEVARSSVLCAFGFDADIFGNDLGAVPLSMRIALLIRRRVQ